MKISEELNKLIKEALAEDDLIEKLSELITLYNFEEVQAPGVMKFIKNDGNYEHELIINDDSIEYKCNDEELTLPISNDIELQKTLKILVDKIESME